MSFILNLLTFLFFIFGTIICVATTEESRKDIRKRVFSDKTPTPEQSSKIESLFIRINALGVLLIILGIGFVVARVLS